MENFDNYNQGNNQNPNVKINPYTGEPIYNQGQGYNQNPNQGYNQNPNQSYNQGYNQAPSQGYNQGYNQSYNQAPNQGYNQGQRNPYTGDSFQARANLSGRNYPQNNYQQNYGQPRYNSYGRNNKKNGCGCALAIVLFMFIFIIVGSVGVFFYLKGHLEEFEEYSSSYSSTTQSTTQDSTQNTEDTSDEKIYTDIENDDNYHGLSVSDPATTMDQVVETFVYLIRQGVEDEVTIYIDGLTTDDLITINTYPEINRYAISDKHSTTLLGSSGTVTYYFKINDSFYVERCFLEGVDIPADKTKAQKLYDTVSEFNSTYITPGMSDYDKELAIHDYLVENTTYGNKTVVIEDEHEAYGALVDHSAVCEGYAKAFELLCTVNDVECMYITGETDEAHGWNLVCINGIWYHVDVTWDDPVDYNESGERTFENYMSHAYFNVSDEVIAQDGHTWDKSYYPAANSMAMNYYSVNGTLMTDYDTFVSTLAANAYSGNTVELAINDYDESTYDIVSIITNNTGFYGGYQWAFSRNITSGFQVIEISFD